MDIQADINALLDKAEEKKKKKATKATTETKKTKEKKKKITNAQLDEILLAGGDVNEETFAILTVKQVEKVEKARARIEKLNNLKKATPKNHFLITSEAWLERLVQLMKQNPLCAVDTETTGLNYIDDKVVGISVAFRNKGMIQAFYIPMLHDEGIQLDVRTVVHHLKPVLEDETIKKVMHNAKYDILMLKTMGIVTKGLIADTQVIAKVMNENASAGLKEQATLYLNIPSDNYEALFGKNRPFNEVSIDFYQYPCKDAELTLMLYEYYMGHFERLPKLKALYFEIEHPLIQVLIDMQSEGIALDTEMCKELDVQFTGHTQKVKGELDEAVSAELKKFREENPEVTSEDLKQELGYSWEDVQDMMDKGINFKSPKQVSFLFFDVMGLPQIKERSTGKKVLNQLSKKHKVPKLLLEYRGETKLLDGFIKALPKMLCTDGKLHANFNQYGAKTGRFSCSNPNLQQIPAKHDEIRKMFIADEGFLLLGADYSQIELRILAHCSQDDALLEAYRTGRDIHSQTTCQVFNYDYDKFVQVIADFDAGKYAEGSKEYALGKEYSIHRKYAKVINFGLVYGMSPMGLADTLDITTKEAEEFVVKYFKAFPKVKSFMESLKAKARKQGFIEDLHGRKRRLPDIYADEFWKRMKAERQAPNFVVQASACSLLKIAMPQVQAYLKTLGGTILLQVHDELIMKVPKTITREQCDKVTEIMCSAVKYSVPLSSDAEIMERWSTKIDMDIYFKNFLDEDGEVSDDDEE